MTVTFDEAGHHGLAAGVERLHAFAIECLYAVGGCRPGGNGNDFAIADDDRAVVDDAAVAIRMRRW